MATRKRIRRSVAVWRELCSRQADSGVSVPEFCRRERVHPSVFRRWRATLKAADRGAGNTSVEAPHAAVGAPFIDLGAIGADGSRLEVRLELGAGLVLSIARG